MVTFEFAFSLLFVNFEHFVFFQLSLRMAHLRFWRGPQIAFLITSESVLNLF